MTIEVQIDNGLRIIKELEMNPYLFIQDKKHDHRSKVMERGGTNSIT